MTNIATEDIPLWQISENKLYRRFRFKSFKEALRFMQIAAEECDAMDHHPKWQNCYRDLEVWLWTHDKKAITEKDISLARKMDKIAQTFV